MSRLATPPSLPRSASRRPRLGVLLGACCLLWAGSLGGQAPDRSSRWVPHRATELTTIVDRIAMARQERDDTAIRDGLLAFAKSLVESVPDGGFPVSDDRWVGPGAYLEELLAVTDEDVRRRALLDIDTFLESRMDRDTALAIRLSRDFPSSRLATDSRARRAELLLESGRIEAYLHLMGEALAPELRRQLVQLLESQRTQPTSTPAGQVLETLGSWSWPSRTNPSSPWRAGALWREPLVQEDQIFLQDSDRLLCIDRSRGGVAWRTEFIHNFPGPLHGSRLAPASIRGAVVTSHLTSISAFEADSGNIRWEVPTASLFEDGSEDAASAEDRQIIVVPPPVATESGVVVAAVQLSGGGCSARVALLHQETGAILWNRAAGTASGATYLGLGSTPLSIAAHGETVHVLTQRGSLSAFHMDDGAFLYSVRYPAYSERGSRDSLRFDERMHGARLEVRADRLVGAPIDAESVFIWRPRDGVLLGEIPRAGARWWTWGEGGRVALVSPAGVRVWDVSSDTPRPVGGAAFPEDHSGATGPAAFAGGEWWIPNQTGYFRVSDDGDESTTHFLPLKFAPESVRPIGNQLLISNSAEFVIMAPTTRRVRGTLVEARRALAAGNGTALQTAVAELREEKGPVPRNQLLALGQEILETSTARSLGLTEAAHAELVDVALDLLPRGDVHAQAAYDRAIDAARRGEVEESLRLLYRGLESPLESRIRVTPEIAVRLEMAAHRLIKTLRDANGTLEVPGEVLRESRRLLDGARPGDSLRGYRETARRFPATPSGRRASLELARRYFLDGNRAQALLVLRQLILFEPEIPESVEARLRVAEIYRDERRYEEARRVLLELRDRFGDAVLESNRGNETVIDRVGRLLADLPPKDGAGRGERDLRRQLVPTWRIRTELLQQRTAAVVPLRDHLDGAPETQYLLIARRSIELRDAQTGFALWVRHFPRTADVTQTLLWPDLGDFRTPIAIFSEGILVHDGDEILFLDLRTGRPKWRWNPDVPSATDSAPGIVSASASPTTLTVLDGSGVIHVVDLALGETRWTAKTDYPVVPPLQVGPRHCVIAFDEPAGFEIRRLDNGDRVYQVEWPEDRALAQSPVFLEDDLLVVPTKDEQLHAVRVPGGEEVWTTPLPNAVRTLHTPTGVPHLIVELARSKRTPTLAGVDPQIGRVLWKSRIQRTQGGDITEVRFHDGSLYVLEESWPNRQITRIEIPPVFLRPGGGRDLPAAEPLEPLWTRKLRWGSHGSHLRFDGEYILIEDGNSCEITVLSRVTGNETSSDRYGIVETFLSVRRRLFFADFLGDTLVVHTKRGSMGFRAMDPLESTLLEWNALSAVDPINPNLSPPPEAAAHAAYRSGRVEDACRILEAIRARPGVPRRTRERITATLEGLGQERGEASPLSWASKRLPQAPTVDATLDEPWNAGTALSLRTPRYFHPMQGAHEQLDAWQGWRDLSAILFTGWSDKGFHLALDVTDDSIHPYDREAKTWIGDCLLLAFDFEGNGGQRPRSDDQLLTLALTVPRPQPKDAEEGAGDGEGGEGEDPPKEADEDPDGQFQVRRKADGSGVVYEVTIPWATFEAARSDSNLPREGVTFRLNVVLTDDDSGQGAKSYLSLSSGQMLQEETSHIWNVFAPEYFAEITLTR